jgi:LacI family transcriptional regulator
MSLGEKYMGKKERVTVKDIASELGISLSTINKALTGKSGVSDLKRAEIIETANKLGYKVNKVAQSLARGQIRVGIIIPSDWPQFYRSMERGLKIEFERLSDFNVEGVFYHFVHKEQLADQIQSSFDELMRQKVDAVILCPVYYNYASILRRLQDEDIPLVLLGNDLATQNRRLTCIRVNAEQSGELAAEMIGFMLPTGSSASVFIGNKDIEVHREKVIGFNSEAKRIGFDIAGVFETQDDSDLAYVLTRKLLNERKDVGAIYVATGNSSAVCRCIEENGFLGRVRVVTTDVFDEQIEYMNKGIVVATIHQNAELQGKLALRALYSYLSEGILPEPVILVAPQIALRCNVEQILKDG